ncbi:hypothetical protein V5F77_06445 [Xanthobacter sp. DSM 24535]|uniref:DUF2946 family protein n=1 Tax=Roseixanthobacter psychrophilus TaxID=3119917 RepID=UPI003729F562
MTAQHPAWKAWTAVAAAYLLVLQVLLIGMSIGAHAGPLSLVDGAGALCLSSSSGGPPAGDDAPAHALPDCCVLGCTMFGPAAAPPPPTALLVPPPRSDGAPIAKMRPSAFVRSSIAHSSSLARAPPAAI